VIAEDNYLVREEVRRLLDDSGRIDVQPTVSTGPELLDAVERLLPDAVITDIRMPPSNGMEGIDAARLIKSRHPGIGVVILSQHANAVYAELLLRDGADGRAYLLKERVSDVEALLRALDDVAAGGSVIDPKIIESLMSRRAHNKESLLSQLSNRELDVLSEMAEGSTNAAIARRLSLAPSTVEKHVTAILSKLGLNEEADRDRRVVAVLTFLRTEGRDSKL
jgi:DNA-binding NarL/FixJ family response regulator